MSPKLSGRDARHLPPGLVLHAQALWPVMAREDQRPPDKDWNIWLLLGGRGSGKTRVGAEWVREQVWHHGKQHVALIAPSYPEGREVMLEGKSGLLNIGYRSERPRYIASRRLLEWENGATGHIYSASDPEQLRGPQFDCAWADEFCAWPYPEETLSNLRLALRLGDTPRLLVTTTPKPTRALAALMNAPGIAVSRSTTHDNRAHLAPGFIDNMEERYGGTPKGRQEFYGEIIDDPEAGLWRRDMFRYGKVDAHVPITKTIVAVDPPGSRIAKNDACGIIIASFCPPIGTATYGPKKHGRIFVRQDATVRGLSTGTWAGRVMSMAKAWNADYIVAESNMGGDMVADVLKQHDPNMLVKLVTATKSKRTRAEPVATLYEQGRVLHERGLEKLEDELIQLGSYDGYVKGKGQSPDRADALVWAAWDLILKDQNPGPRVMGT